MAYELIIDLNPADYQENDVEVKLKSNNDNEAAEEARELLKSGDYQPSSTDRDPNEESQIIGCVYKDDKDIATIYVRFTEQFPYYTNVVKNF